MNSSNGGRLGIFDYLVLYKLIITGYNIEFIKKFEFRFGFDFDYLIQIHLILFLLKYYLDKSDYVFYLLLMDINKI